MVAATIHLALAQEVDEVHQKLFADGADGAGRVSAAVKCRSECDHLMSSEVILSLPTEDK